MPSSQHVKGIAPGDVSEELQTKRLLVVADESGIRLLLSKLLPHTGYVLDVAGDVSLAWEMVGGERYDALVIDLEVRSSGEELYQHLNDVDKLLARRVIFLTGITVGHEWRSFMAATGNPIIEKPFDLEELQRQLRSLFDDKGDDMELARPEERQRVKDTAPGGKKRATSRRSTGRSSSVA